MSETPFYYPVHDYVCLNPTTHYMETIPDWGQTDCLVILDDHPFSKKALVQNEIFSVSFLASSQSAPNLEWSPDAPPSPDAI